MKDFGKIDITILCVISPFALYGQELTDTIDTLKPEVVIPVHWKETSRKPVDELIENYSGKTEILLLN